MRVVFLVLFLLAAVVDASKRNPRKSKADGTSPVARDVKRCKVSSSRYTSAKEIAKTVAESSFSCSHSANHKFDLEYETLCDSCRAEAFLLSIGPHLPAIVDSVSDERLSELTFGGSPLVHIAMLNWDEKYALHLLKRPVDFNVVHKGITPLRLALKRGFAYAVSMIVANNIAKGLEVVRESRTDLALYYAAKYGHENICRLVLEYKIFKDQLKATDKTSLLFSKLDKDAVSLLLKLGAPLQGVVDDQGMTPLHRAAVNGSPSLVALFLNCGLLPTVRDSKSRTPLMLATSHLVVHLMAKRHPASLLDIDPSGNTPLHHACLNRSYGAIIELIRLLPADKINIANAADMFPLDAFMSVYSVDSDWDMVMRFMIKCGARVSFFNSVPEE